MLSDKSEDILQTNFNLDNKNISIENLINFIKLNINDFINNYSDCRTEKILTKKLIIFLNLRSNIYLFDYEYFENEESGNSPSVDIGVLSKSNKKIIINTKNYACDEAFFIIEAKRLDSKIDKRREKEYVVGRIENIKYIDSGGIERFKKEIHGRKMNFTGMIGYIQTNDFDYWLTQINQWIDEQIPNPNSSNIKWTNQDKLIIKLKKNEYSECHSKHSRIKLEDIFIYHIWIKL